MAESSGNEMKKGLQRWNIVRQRGVFVGAFMLVLAVFIMAGTSRADRMGPAPIKKSKTSVRDNRVFLRYKCSVKTPPPHTIRSG